MKHHGSTVELSLRKAFLFLLTPALCKASGSQPEQISSVVVAGQGEFQHGRLPLLAEQRRYEELGTWEQSRATEAASVQACSYAGPAIQGKTTYATATIEAIQMAPGNGIIDTACQIQAALLDSDNHIDPVKMQHAVEHADPVALYAALLSCSHIAQGESDDFWSRTLAALRTMEEHGAMAVAEKLLLPTKAQAGAINAAYSAFIRSGYVNTTLRNGFLPALLLVSDLPGVESLTHAVAFRLVKTAFLKLNAFDSGAGPEAIVFHELCHLFAHTQVHVSVLSLLNSIPSSDTAADSEELYQHILEILAEGFASQWTGKVADSGYENGSLQSNRHFNKLVCRLGNVKWSPQRATSLVTPDMQSGFRILANWHFNGETEHTAQVESALLETIRQLMTKTEDESPLWQGDARDEL